MQACGESWGTLNNIITPCVIKFKKYVDAIHLKLSPKAAIVASYECQSTLNSVLASEGVIFKVVKHHRDLGVTYAAALSRPKHILINRFSANKSKL